MRSEDTGTIGYPLTPCANCDRLTLPGAPLPEPERRIPRAEERGPPGRPLPPRPGPHRPSGVYPTPPEDRAMPRLRKPSALALAAFLLAVSLPAAQGPAANPNVRSGL